MPTLWRRWRKLMTSRPPEHVGASIAAGRGRNAGSVPGHFAHDAARSYVDGDRMRFVGADIVVSVDDRQNAVVFDSRPSDIALCV